MSTKLTGLSGHLLAAAAGALVTLSLAPFGYWPLGIVSCALLAYLLHDLSAAQTALRGWFYGFGLFAAGTSWVYVSIHSFGNAPVPLALFLTLLFSIGLGLFTAIPLYFYGRYIPRNIWGSTLGFAAVWGLAEWLRSWLLTGFPWLFLGYGHLDSPLSGWAPLAGVMSISFVIALTGATLSELIRHRKVHWPSVVITLCLWLAGPLLNTIDWTKPSNKADIKVALVQANIPQKIKWQRDQYWPTLNLYRQLSEPLWATNDIVIWPEAAIPDYYQAAKPFLDRESQRARDNNSTLITGLPTMQVNEPGQRSYYNSVIALGMGEGLYHKQQLVPFGEYVPLETWLRGLIDFFDLPMSAFTAGEANQPLLKAGNVLISPSVCYEVVYADLVASTVPAADILLTVSNDAWFGESIGPLQHMEMAQMRALETGRYMIRATGNGISAIVNERGQILKRSQQFKREVLKGTAQLREGATPFALTGTLPFVLACLALSTGLIYQSRRSR